MGILSSIKARVSGRGRGSGASGYLVPSQSSPPDRNAQEWLEAYNHSPRLAPITKIATDLASVGGTLYRAQRDGSREEITDHPFLTLMARPNPLPQMTRSALWRLMEVYLMLKGDAYAIIERGRDGAPCELWPIPVHWVLMTPTLDNPYYLIRANNNGVKQIMASDMYVQRDLDPVNPYLAGSGQAEAVADEIEADEYMAKYIKTFFYNHGTPSVILSAPDATQEQVKRLQASMDARHRGVGNAHRLGILGGVLNAVRLSDSQREMDFAQSRKDMRDAVNSHFGIPPELMGIVENSNRASITMAKIIYAENVLKPHILPREDAVNQQLLTYWGDDLVWEYDDIVPQDEAYRLEVASAGLAGGALTVDEWREANGFEALPDNQGQERLVPVSSIPVALDGRDAQLTVNARAADAPEARGGTKAAAGRANPRRAAAQRQAERLLSAQELAVRRQIEHYFAQEIALIEAALLAGRKAQGGWLDEIIATTAGAQDVELTRSMIMESLGDLIDWDAQRVKLERIMRPLWGQGFDAGAQAAQQMGVPAVSAPMLTQRLIDKGCDRLDEIEATTQRALARSLADGLQAGESNGQLSKRVQEHMPHVQTGRATTIATTEAHTSIMAGTLEQMRAAGVTHKTWVTAGDGTVRDAHADMNGETVPVEQPFSNGLMYPGDPSGPPGQIINCRCTLMMGEGQAAVSPVDRSVQEEEPQQRITLDANYINPNGSDNSRGITAAYKNTKPLRGYEDVQIHGSAYEFMIETYQGDKLYYSPEEIADMMLRDPASTYKGGKVRLLSCSAGAKPDGAAQQLADRLGVEVLAPTETLNIYGDGTLIVSDDIFATKDTGEWITFSPDPPERGAKE